MLNAWKMIGQLTDKNVLGTDGLSAKEPRRTSRAILINQDGQYAVMYAKKFNLHSLPGGGIDNGESEVSALVREVFEETGCTCDSIEPLGIVSENRYHADFTSLSYYFVVHTKTKQAILHLTDAEIENGTTLKWCSFNELYSLIKDIEHETNQRKFLQARDLLALEEYQKKLSIDKALFWDLQGTLGGDAVASIELFEPYSFSKEALKLAKDNGYRNIVITNQSRIGKGTLSVEVYNQEAERILNYFNSDEVLIDEIFCCPHQSSDHCECKKPKTGLIQLAVEKYKLDIKNCFVIGDMGKNEIVMAYNAGCKGVLVLTGGGKGSLDEFRHTWAGYEAHIIADNALQAVKEILKEKS